MSSSSPSSSTSNSLSFASSLHSTLRDPSFMHGLVTSTVLGGLFCVGKLLYRRLHNRHAKYKLIYFAGRGLGETARYLMSYGDYNFEDVRYPITFIASGVQRAEWDKDKELYVYGKIPELHVDGFRISQSKAIERFLGHRLQIMGKGDGETALIDACGEQIRDVQTAYQKAKTESKDSKEKDTPVSKFFANDLQEAFRLFSRQQLNENYLCGGKLSLADFQLFSFIHSLAEDPNMQSALKTWNTIDKVYKNVLNLPQIQRWLATRPVSSF